MGPTSYQAALPRGQKNSKIKVQNLKITIIAIHILLRQQIQYHKKNFFQDLKLKTFADFFGDFFGGAGRIFVSGPMVKNAVACFSRNDMKMEMIYHLSCCPAVVAQHIITIAAGRLLYGSSNPCEPASNLAKQLWRRLVEFIGMLPGDNKRMAIADRADIQKSNNQLILKNYSSRYLL
jgi:hypothetical protein